MQKEELNLYRVFRNTYEYTTIKLKSDQQNPEQLVQDLLQKGDLKFNDTQTDFTVIREYSHLGG